MTPQVRQWIYTVASIASALVPLLVAYKVFDAGTGSAWLGVFGALGAFGSGTAAVMTSKQRKDGTLDFSGSAADQAIAAIQATVSQASTAATDLEKVKTAVTGALAPVSQVANDVITGPLATELINAVTGRTQP